MFFSAFLFLLTTHAFQSFLARQIVSYVSASYDVNLSVDELSVKSLSRYELKGLLILDHKMDTMLSLKSLELDLHKIDLTNNEFKLNALRIHEAKFYLINHRGDSLSNISIFIDVFASNENDSSSLSIDCDELMLTDCSFSTNNEQQEPISKQIDFNHLELTKISATINELQFDSQKFLSTVSHFSAENPYLSINDMKTALSIDKDSLQAKDLQILTMHSNLKGDFMMAYSKGMSDFNEDVFLKLASEESILGTSDLAAFSASLFGLQRQVNLTGEVSGNVNHLNFEDLHISEEFSLKLNGRLDNIEEPENISFSDLNLEAEGDFSQLPAYPFHLDSLIGLPSLVDKLQKPSFKGSFDGDLQSLETQFQFLDQFIKIEAKGNVQNALTSDLSIALSGEIYSNDISYIAEIEDLGLLNSDFDLRIAGSEFSESELSLNMDIHAFEYRNYTYDSLLVSANYKEKLLASSIVINDEKLKSFVESRVLIEDSKIEAYTTILAKQFDPYGLNLSPDYDSLRLNIKLIANFTLIDNELKSLDFDFDTLELNNRSYNYADAQLKLAYNKGNVDSFLFKSKAAIVEAEGNLMGLDLEEIEQKIKSNLGVEALDEAGSLDDIQIRAEFMKMDNLLGIFLPDLNLASGTSIDIRTSETENSISAKLRSTEIALSGTELKNCYLDFLILNNQTDLKVGAENLNIGDSLSLSDLELKLSGLSDSLNLNIQIDREHKNDLSAWLNSSIDLNSDLILLDVEGGELNLKDSIWKIESVAELRLDTSGLLIPLLNASSGSKFLNISGKIGRSINDKLRISFERLNLGNLDEIASLEKLKLNGSLSGYVQLRASLAEVQMDADLGFDALKVNGQTIGDGNFKALWDKDNKGLSLKGSVLERLKPVIWFNGEYYPGTSNELDFSLLVRDLKLKSLEPFLASYISEIEGTISGDLKLKGSVEEPLLYSDMEFHKAAIKINYLGTKYFVHNQKAKIRKDWFGFDLIEFKDSEGHLARATATIFHDNYSNMNYDVNLLSDEFSFLNTSFKDNELYYGQANLGGDVNISGYGGELAIEANVETKKGTKLFIPLEGAEEVTKNDYIVFVQKDSAVLEDKYEVKLDGISMDLNIDMTPDAEVQLIFDELAGDIMKVSGEGAIQLGINTLGEFNMFGTYELTRGDYLFTLQNVINKRFNLNKGSTINWTGNPLHAKLDVSADYNVKARLSDLLQDDNLSNRVNTSVKLYMKNDLMSPDISFGIEFPELDEATKSRAAVALNNEEQVNRQVFSLMLLNSFSPPEGGLQASGSAGATSSELLANQLSNWMSQLSDKLLISVSDLNSESFELGLSRGFFSDRVTVEGNVGVTSSEDASTQENASRLVGDVKVEYKITKDGKLRAKVFNESNDDALVNQQNAKDTQGIGIFYRQEFNSWAELWKGIFKKDNKKGSDKSDPS